MIPQLPHHPSMRDHSKTTVTISPGHRYHHPARRCSRTSCAFHRGRHLIVRRCLNWCFSHHHRTCAMMWHPKQTHISATGPTPDICPNHRPWPRRVTSAQMTVDHPTNQRNPKNNPVSRPYHLGQTPPHHGSRLKRPLPYHSISTKKRKCSLRQWMATHRWRCQ